MADSLFWQLMFLPIGILIVGVICALLGFFPSSTPTSKNPAKRLGAVLVGKHRRPPHRHHRHPPHHHRKKRPQISFLVPFRADPTSPERLEIWTWLRKFTEINFPDAEIIVGNSRGKVFSKTRAVNAAARKAKGRIFVILDSDAYIRPEVIQECANRIDASLRRGRRMWFIPYRHLYRLTKAASREVLDSDPANPLQFSQPPPKDDILNIHGSQHGRRYGALVQIMPREAFFMVGGMDNRFEGWGGEDIAFVFALDTLYAHHKTTRNDVLHLWHKVIGREDTDRMWAGQLRAVPNSALASRYSHAVNDPARMRALVDGGRARKGLFARWR